MAADIDFDFEKVVDEVVSRKYEEAISIDKSFRKENPKLYNQSINSSFRSMSPKIPKVLNKSVLVPSKSTKGLETSIKSTE